VVRNIQKTKTEDKEEVKFAPSCHLEMPDWVDWNDEDDEVRDDIEDRVHVEDTVKMPS
jgi:hypothetical protein